MRSLWTAHGITNEDGLITPCYVHTSFALCADFCSVREQQQNCMTTEVHNLQGTLILINYQFLTQSTCNTKQHLLFE